MIGNKIKNLRIQKGVTQEMIARHLHLSPQAVSKWEQNISKPDISVLVPLANFFGVTTDYLLRAQVNMEEPKMETLIEARFQRIKSTPVFSGYVKNNSGKKLSVLSLKIKFKDTTGDVIDYREEVIHELGADEKKQITVFTQVAKDVVDTEIEMLKYDLA